MAARRKGAFELEEVIETGKTIPVDARQLVRSKEEMLDAGSFTNGYNGMFTSERTEGKIWMLMDKDNPTLETSWKVIGPYDDSALDARVTALEQAGGSESDPVDWSDVQNKPTFSAVATSGSYNDLTDRPVLPAPYDDSALSGRVSALENAGFLTEHQDISGKANVADLSAVATSGSYNDLSDQPTIPEAYDDTGLRNRVTALENKTETQADWNESDSTSAAYIANKPTIPPAVTVDAAMSDTSENPVQNKVVLAAIGDAIDVVETAIADRYTKAETDAKIAEAMTDVDNEHFHPVTALPDPSVAKENHEYVLITYAQDGTTIESETHYLFYGGVFHEKQTQVSLDGYATEVYVDTAVQGLDTRVTALENAPATIPTLQQIYDEANGRPSIQWERETEALRVTSTTRLLGSQITIRNSQTDKVSDITTTAQTEIHAGIYRTFSGDEELKLRPDQFYIGTTNQPEGSGVPAFQIDFKVEGEKNVIISDERNGGGRRQSELAGCRHSRRRWRRRDQCPRLAGRELGVGQLLQGWRVAEHSEFQCGFRLLHYSGDGVCGSESGGDAELCSNLYRLEADTETEHACQRSEH